MHLLIQHLKFVQGCACFYFAALNLPSRREIGGPCCHKSLNSHTCQLLVPSEQTDPRRVLEYISWLALSFGHSWNKAKIGLLTKGNQFIGWGSPAPKSIHLGQSILEGNSWTQIDSLLGRRYEGKRKSSWKKWRANSWYGGLVEGDTYKEKNLTCN